MVMGTQLAHIFDESTCLTRRQLRDYVHGTMGAEECHAAEHHINSCPFCSEAIEGMAIHEAEAVSAVSELNTRFLKEHFDRHLPQVHLNSLAPVAVADHTYNAHKKHKNGLVLTRTSVAAAILLALGVMGYLRFEKHPDPAMTPQEGPENTTTTVNNNRPSTPHTTALPIVSPAKEQVIVNNTGKATQPTVVVNKPTVNTSAAVVKHDKKKATPFVADDNVRAGNDLYKNSDWAGALSYYQREMDSGSSQRQRHEATIMAAHCYEQMGQSEKAQALLKDTTSEDKPQQEDAKKMLQESDNAQE